MEKIIPKEEKSKEIKYKGLGSCIKTSVDTLTETKIDRINTVPKAKEVMKEIIETCKKETKPAKPCPPETKKVCVPEEKCSCVPKAEPRKAKRSVKPKKK